MSYLGELRRNIRPLAAAAIGSGSGLMVAAYATSVFAPYLLKAFGWSRQQFALIGLTMFSTLLVMPFVGRLTDRLGVRRMALLGAFLLPVGYIGYSLMQGSFAVFMLLSATVLAAGSLTGPAVYTRLIAENFVKARGLALTVVTCAPALVGAAAAPLLTAINEEWGWRAGYRVFAAYILTGNLVAAALVPPVEPGLAHGDPAPARAGMKPSPGAFREILRSPTFWAITGALMLCCIATPLHSSQMNLMLLDTGLNRQAAAYMVSIYAIGTIVGRIACGLALDRFSPARVASLSMGLPAIGYALIASCHAAPGQVALPAASVAMLLIGLAYGAENDLSSFLVARHFRLEVFSTALSLALCGVLFASASGALLLSLILKHYNSFTPFLYTVSGSVLAGSLLFLALGRRAITVPAPGQVPA